MLRLKLLLGLLTLIVILWGVGAAALLLMRDANKRFDRRLSEDYEVVSTANGFRSVTSTLNSTYIPLLLARTPETTEPLDPTSYNVYSRELQNRLEHLRHFDIADDTLTPAVTTYLASHERLIARPPTVPADRDKLISSISVQTQRLTDLADAIAKEAENNMMTRGKREATDTATQNYLFVSSLVLLGTAIAFIIYFQLVRHLVDPVTRLRLSIDQIRDGNFELALPEPNQESEFRPLIAAFNDMALELKQRRHEMNENLRKADLVNRAILEGIPSPVFILGDDSNIVQINPSAEDLTEKLGVSGRLPLKIQRILDGCRKTGAHFLPEDPREALLFRIHEEEFYYLPRIFRFVSEDGKNSGWAVLLHNVSRIRWLDDMKTNLISTVSHEIKTPLTGIRMVLHLLLEENDNSLNTMQRTMVDSANEDCERLLVTLNTLLDLSRAESGTTHLSRAPISIPQAAERSAHLYLTSAASKGCTITTEQKDDELPEVFADPVRLDEVLNNLVSNAIKHSPAGGKITIRYGRQGAEYVRVSVLDQGPGVPEASQARIFERFYRAPGQTNEGVGLGLFISREIMRAHEGRIGLQERSNEETEFYIDVPIA